MKKFIGILAIVLIGLSSCKKEKVEDNGAITSATISSNVMNYSDWWQQTQGSNGNNNDAWVNAHLSATSPGTLYFGDDLLWNWLTVPSGTFPNAHWPIQVAGYTMGLNRGIRGVSYRDAWEYLDSLKKYRGVVASLDVTLGTHDIFYYKNYGGNLWNTSPLQQDIKKFIWKALGYFPTQKITVRAFPVSITAINTPELVAADLYNLNASLKAWCDSSLTDRVIYSEINSAAPPGIGNFDFGAPYDVKFPSTQGYYNLAQRYTAVNWGTPYTNPVPPVALANGTSTGSLLAVCKRPNLQFTVDGTYSYDPDGTIIKYKWTSLSSSYTIITDPTLPVITVQRNSPWPVLVPYTTFLELEVTDNHYNVTKKQFRLMAVTCS